MNEPEGMNQNLGDQASPPPTPPPVTPPPVAPPQGPGGPGHGEPIWTAESAPPPEKKKSHLWLWILLGVFLALIVAGAVVIGVYRSNTADVPDLRGLTVSEGVRALNDVELELGKVDYTSEVPAGLEEGQIVSQRPDAGEQVEQGTAVDVVVAGKAEVEVPDVMGLTVEEATQTLEDAGLKVKSVDVENEAEVGTVVDQSPAAGEMVLPGSQVTVLVSAGVGETLVPNVVGLDQEEATAILNDAGYEVQSKGSYDEEVAEGIVISQSPEGGVVAEPGTRVDIVVSQGKNPEAKVPDVVGKSEADAAKTLEDAGFEVVPSPTYNETVPVGQVVGQDPAGGATANRGSAVTITVSQGPQPPETATVPNVVGKQEAEAVDALQKAGYQVAIVDVYSDVVPQGAVGLQSPVGGSITEPGITVGIVVSTGPRPPEFVIVPDVVGMSLEEATAVLEEAGLVAESVEIFTSLAPQGELFAQLPPPEASVAVGSTVFLVISKGPYPEINPL
jgi:beta-lactam-binding protein with PASTA domain